MAAVSSESKRTRFAGFIRSFRTSSQEESWYIPYNGPIEEPKSYNFTNHDPFERGRSTLARPLTHHGTHDARSSLSEFDGQSRISHSSHISRPSARTADVGSVGNSPVAVVTDSDRKKGRRRSSVPSRELPPTQWTSFRHPFNPQHTGVLSFPSAPAPIPPPNASRATQPLHNANFQFDRPHPYSAGALNRTALPAPVTDKKPTGRSRAFTTGHTPFQPYKSSPLDFQRASDALKSPPRLRPEIRFEGARKEQSTRQQFQPVVLPSAPTSAETVDPSFSLHHHPFATARSVQTKPPVPSKSRYVLNRLRSSTSAPNLSEKASRTGGAARRPVPEPIVKLVRTVHELPLALAPESTLQAVAHPRPKFTAKHVFPDDLPASPYSLAPPHSLSRRESEPNLLSRCLPTPTKKLIKKRVPPRSAPVESHKDPLVRVVRENEQLSAERAEWAHYAERGFGNKRSRSLSMHRTGSTIRSSNAVHATPRRTNAQESSANVASGTTEAGTVTTSSKSTSQHGSFKYLAAAAFGHAHSPRVSIDGSAVTSLSRHSSENKGIRPRSRLDSAKSAVRSNLDTLGHSRKNSNQAVIEAISGVSLSASADGQTFWSEPTFAEIVDIRRHTGAFGPPEESIGVALSTPPVTPEGARSSSPSLPNTSSSIIRAGPHPSSPVLAGRFPGHSDIASRHRLPPQVHAHKRSISTGKASFPFPVSPKSEAPSMLDSTPTSMSSHPFAGSNSETGDRPSSHLVQESFEREMMEANRSPWVERTADVGAELQQLSSQLLKDGKADFPPTIAPPTQETSHLGPRHPTAGPSSSIPSRHLGQRQFAREGGARRSISVQEILSPLERTIRHERSRSLSVSTPPMGGHSDIESSFGSALPELIIGGTDDLEEFRDLFYRPDSEVHPSPNALSHRPDSPIHLDVTTEWIQASFKAESGEGDDQTNRDHHSVLDHQEKVSDSGSMYMGEVGTSLPNIQDSIQRHSSTPVIEQPKSFPELVFTSNNDQDDQLEPTNIPVSIFRPDSLSLPPLAGYVSSGSDDGGLEFHPRERVSHIIRDFPTPPDVTPVAATILSSYFAEPLSGAPSSPAHSSHPDLKHYDIS